MYLAYNYILSKNKVLDKLLGAFLILIVSPHILLGQCMPGPCSVCDVSANITSIEGGTIINGSSSLNEGVSAGGSSTATNPMVITATGSGVITLTVDLSFTWDQGDNINWIHGISFSESEGWTAAQGTINPNDPGWIFLNSIIGLCSGINFGTGYYWDPAGFNCTEEGNFSNFNGTDCGLNEFCEDNVDYLVDGDPSDNWGIDCTDDCPRFGFVLSFCPTKIGTINEEISFFLTEDGESGAWNYSDGCVFELVFPIIFESAGIQIPEMDQEICLGECITLDAGAGSELYEWSTGQGTQAIEVCPNESTIYGITVTSNSDCIIEAEASLIVNPCCAADAGELLITNQACNEPSLMYVAENFGENSSYQQTVLVTDLNGTILDIFLGNSGEYTYENAGTYIFYSYNYLNTSDSFIPNIGMNISSIDCTMSCCELVSEEINIDELLQVMTFDIDQTGTLTCEGGEICFDASNSISSNPIEFAWYDLNGNLLESNNSIFCTSTTNEVVVEMLDLTAACAIYDTISFDTEIIIPVIGLPNISIENLEAQEISVSIDIPQSQVSEIIWYPTDLFTCIDCQTTTIENPEDGLEIFVEVVSTSGCIATDSTTIRLEKAVDVYIPNIFQPDSDFGNDFLSLYSNDEVALITQMSIYDRWGNLVFSISDIPPNEPSLGWNGRFNGIPADIGVYVYFFEVLNVGGERQIFTGDVSLVR